MKNKIVNKKITRFRPMILSRHPSHNCLRMSSKNLPLMNIRSVVRFGSITEVSDTIVNGGNRIEINTIQSIKNSANKLLMKNCFMEAKVKTAPWISNINEISSLEFPIVTKSHYGSKGVGNTLINSQEEFNNWKEGKNLSNYIYEKFVNFGHEFRLHVTEDGCFYACRKALKQNVPDSEKWRRHDDICVWFLEENENFMKPNSWNDIINDCVKALKSIGADILSFDVKVQTPFDKKGNRRQYQEYILLECNSASSMNNGVDELSICAKKYIEILPEVIIKKSKKNV